MRRGITLWASVALLWFATPCAGWCQSGGKPAGPRNDVVAILLTGAGEAAGAITVTYPGRTDGGVAEQDLAAVARATGWQLGAPQIVRTKDSTEVTCGMTPGAQSGGRGGEPVWPLAVALKRFNRVTVVVIGKTFETQSRTLQNKFIRMTCSSGMGMTSYDVTVLDRGFRDAAEVSRGEEVLDAQPGQPAVPATQQETGQTRLWLWLALAAVVIGVSVYLVAAWLVNPADPEERRRRARSRALRSRRARNVK